ncbi:hypothetical protein [Virgibacillus necropolis]|nr:hypothetical protein [Virgibacillus necropolis]
MNPLTLNIKLSQAFKHKLDRELTNNEEDFIKWIVEQEIDKKRLKEALTF